MASNVSDVVQHTLSKVDKSFIIKPKQLEAIRNVVNKTDTLAILPTSYGKSLIYQLIPAVFKSLGLAANPMVIVISPLRSLIQDQISAASKLSNCLDLFPSSLESISTEQLCSGKINLVIDTPEAWLNDPNWCNALSSKFVRDNLTCIVVDEAHLVSWGLPSHESERAFREAFSRISSLRSFCGETIPVLALSATVNQDLSHLISSCCGLSKTLKTIYTTSNRENIRLSLVKLKSKDHNCFQWVFDQIRDNGVDCPKILIYCRTQTMVGWLYEKFLNALKKDAFKGKEKINENLLVGMYHSCSLDINKDRVLNALSCNTVMRVFIATSALGCGVNAKDLKYVFHFGPAHSLIDYCQQIGRAGRSGESKRPKAVWASKI